MMVENNNEMVRSHSDSLLIKIRAERCKIQIVDDSPQNFGKNIPE